MKSFHHDFFLLKPQIEFAGGRSGVYLAIDTNIELAEEEESFYVFGYLKKLRQSRKGLIESVDQYKFVYDTLEEYVVCGNSFFPVKELSQKLKQKSVKDLVTKINEYQREYAQICKQTPRFSIGDCAGGHRGDNREKNRDVLCVPRKWAFVIKHKMNDKKNCLRFNDVNFSHFHLVPFFLYVVVFFVILYA